MNEFTIQIIRAGVQSLIPLYGTYEEAELIVLWMLSAITGKSKLELLLSQKELAEKHKEMLALWIIEHVTKSKPLAYIIGSVPFINCTIAVEPPLLIPRPETEEWIANLIQKLQKLPNKKITILDLCTGSGAIACALAKALPEAMVIATDISEIALAVVKKNAEANGVAVTCIQSDLFSALQGMHFDLIVSNPPYISHDDWKNLDPMVKDWEDYHALVASNNGLSLIQAIIEQSGSYSVKNSQLRLFGIAQLYCEIGYDQGVVALHALQRHFSDEAVLLRDYNQKDRVVCGSLPELLQADR